MKRRLAVESLFFLLVAWSFCADSWAETIRVVGAGGPMLLLRDAAQAFAKTHPGAEIQVPESSGTGGGIRAVGDGDAELGRVAREPSEGKEKAYGLVYVPFAKTPVVFATWPGLKIEGLTKGQTRDIFSGMVTNWKEVGGPDLKIRVIRRHEGESNLLAIRNSIPEWAGVQITPKSKEGSTDQETVLFIKENEGAIGFCALNDARAEGLNVLSLDGVAPIKAAYPIQIIFAFVYKEERFNGLSKDFVDFVFSADGARIIERNAAFPIRR